MQHKILFSFMALILVMTGCDRSKSTSLEGVYDPRREWVKQRTHSSLYKRFHNVDYRGDYFWIEYPLLKGTTGRVVTPDTVINLACSGLIDGDCNVYYIEGPFAGLKAIKYPYVRGQISGVCTYWNNGGKITRQEKRSDSRASKKGGAWMPQKENIIEVKTSPPWWNEEQDQTLPDGVYTTTASPYSPCIYQHVIEQRRYSSGEQIEIRNEAPWLESHPDFWKSMDGIIVLFPELGTKRYMLNGKRLNEGQVLQIRNGPKVKFSTGPNVFKSSSHPDFYLQEEYSGLEKGDYVELRNTALFDLVL